MESRTVYRVVRDHSSEYPDPVSFSRGEWLSVRHSYDGPEDWSDWIWCETADGRGGWVPLQLLQRCGERTAKGLEDYTARELDVQTGDELIGTRSLNGWMWCEHTAGKTSGWVPASHLERKT